MRLRKPRQPGSWLPRIEPGAVQEWTFLADGQVFYEDAGGVTRVVPTPGRRVFALLSAGRDYPVSVTVTHGYPPRVQLRDGDQLLPDLPHVVAIEVMRYIARVIADARRVTS